MSLLRSAATVSSFTLVSRITGLIRDILIAASFGAGPLTDAFWVAFRIPNLLRRLFAEGAFSQAFVPVLGQARSTRSEEAVRVLLDRVALLLTCALMLVTVAGIIAAPWVVSAMASGMRTAADVGIRLNEEGQMELDAEKLTAASWAIAGWNAAAERTFGYSEQEMVGQSIFVLIPEELHDSERELLASIATQLANAGFGIGEGTGTQEAAQQVRQDDDCNGRQQKGK